MKFNELTEVLSEVDAKMRKTTGSGLADVLAPAVINTYVFSKAARHAKAGNYLPAIYWGVVWHGVSSNYGRTMAFKQRQVLAGVRWP